jgi:ribonuclease Y
MTQQTIIIIVAGCGGIGIAFLAGFFWRVIVDRNYKRKKVEDAENEAYRIVEESKKEAALNKKSAILEGKNEWFREKAKFEKEVEQRKEELRQQQQQIKELRVELDNRSENITKREKEFKARENFLASKEESLSTKEQELERQISQENQRLEQISKLSESEAKEILMKNLESQIRYECSQMIKESRDKARAEANREAKEVVLQAMQRCAADTTTESTVSVVHLPNEEMKGRIIGREGRNIRSFEEATNINVIVDDTPEAVILSGFDPVRREIARIAMEKLIADGRIHPGRIEEVIEKSEQEVNEIMREAAEDVILELGVHGISDKLTDLLGRLKYRASYGQNVLQHTKEVAILSGIMASELGLDSDTAVRAGLLHDIGKAVDREMKGTHSELGAEIAKKHGESEIIVNAIAAHHEDIEATSLYAPLVKVADTVSSSRPGVRRETLAKYIDRLTNLERIADSFKGVSKSYVIQAGREIRTMVEPKNVDDSHAEEMATQIAKKIENEMEYPGQITVTIIRESRYTQIAQ